MPAIHYVEYDAAHQHDFVYSIPEGLDAWLLVLTQTPALFEVNGELKEFPAHSAVLYPPKHSIYYRACSRKYVNDWVRFDADESYITETVLPVGTPFSLPDPGYCHQLFQLLTLENSFQNDYRELSIDYLFRLLFNKLSEASEDKLTPQYYNLLELRKTLYSNPGHPWTVSSMAGHLHISTGYLQTIYKSTFGISCMEDVIHCRIRLAKEKLGYGQHKIAEIAALCGYANVEHFCRQFRQLTGFSPRAYREKLASKQAETRQEE
ncbi:AraC family transcriptional regulator [Paenibacillus sp. FSL R10-2199]|uniref:helix-turn-helix transcriptional regulator n=1 Tax=Paenibacillus sp. FSL R10-2199 TaxID=2975348 RepID=UPI0030FB9EA7